MRINARREELPSETKPWAPSPNAICWPSGETAGAPAGRCGVAEDHARSRAIGRRREDPDHRVPHHDFAARVQGSLRGEVVGTQQVKFGSRAVRSLNAVGDPRGAIPGGGGGTRRWNTMTRPSVDHDGLANSPCVPAAPSLNRFPAAPRTPRGKP